MNNVNNTEIGRSISHKLKFNFKVYSRTEDCTISVPRNRIIQTIQPICIIFMLPFKIPDKYKNYVFPIEMYPT